MGDSTSESDDTDYSEEENEQTDEEWNMMLFNHGIELKAAGQLDEALKYFTKCLDRVNREPTKQFTKLPHCLGEIAAIYYEKEDYRKAIYFAQAEKFCYEAQLINSADDTLCPKFNNLTDGPFKRTIDEYEALADICFQLHCVRVGLKYCGKTVKMRQSALGPSDPATIRGLDMFTASYTEADREKYADALRIKYDSTGGIDVVEQPDDCDKNYDESEESQASVTTDLAQSAESSTVLEGSSTMYSKKSILFYFLLSCTFAVILSFWIVW